MTAAKKILGNLQKSTNPSTNWRRMGMACGCRLSSVVVVCAIVVAWMLRSFKQGGDATAQGVAKARHMETIWPLEADQERLFEDPHASHFYTGAGATQLFLEWAGPETIFGLMNNLQAAVQPTLAGRTAEFDRQVRAAVEAGCKQYVILGAGYDTRALRLDLPKDVQIFEIDQPGVQERKRAKLSSIPGLSLPSSVHFVPVDFSTESIAMLLKHPAYDPTVPTVFTLEGVTQYISKEATASTLASAAELSGPGSRFLASYVPQELWDSPEKCGVDAGQFSTFLWQVATIAGEPWISGWGAPELAAQMHAHGFMVERDVSLRDLNKDFFEPAGRPIPEQHQVILERCATAIKNSDGHAD